jgi:hypothetical protein
MQIKPAMLSYSRPGDHRAEANVRYVLLDVSLALFGHAELVAACPLSGVRRKSDFGAVMSPSDPSQHTALSRRNKWRNWARAPQQLAQRQRVQDEGTGNGEGWSDGRRES